MLLVRNKGDGSRCRGWTFKTPASRLKKRSDITVLKRGAHQTEGRGEEGGRTVISSIQADAGATA
jgi:hypothetical protein